jgi:hypothetical protein
MLAGTTYPVTINVSVVSFSASSGVAGECWREYMVRVKNASRFEACGCAQQWVRQSLANCCRQYGDACGECRRNYM